MNDTSTPQQGAQRAADRLAELTGVERHDVALVLGSGWLPAVDALGESFTAARTAAEEGAVATTPLQARKGRASYLGERSIGHQDPGATSAALLIAGLTEAAGE